MTMCGESGSANPVKIVLSFIATFLTLLSLACLIVSLATPWYIYTVNGDETTVKFDWSGWHVESNNDDDHRWDPGSGEPRLFTLYIICAVGTGLAALVQLGLLALSIYLIITAFRGAINLSPFAGCVIGVSVFGLVVMFVVILIFIAHPSAFHGDVDQDENGNGAYGIPYCTIGDVDFGICNEFAGEETILGVDYEWRPYIGWIFAILATPFAITAFIFYFIIAGRCCYG